MRLLWLVLALALGLAWPGQAAPAGGSNPAKSTASPETAHRRSAQSRRTTCCGSHKGWHKSGTTWEGLPAQDPNLERHKDAKKEFMRRSGYPHGRKGYVVDYVVTPACGGKEEPSNLQWLPEVEARALDLREGRSCGR